MKYSEYKGNEIEKLPFDIGAILIVILNIFLLSIIVYSKYKEFKIKLENKITD